jgi:hypothetical protein
MVPVRLLKSYGSGSGFISRPKDFLEKTLPINIVSLFTRKKFKSFIKFIVKCEEKMLYEGNEIHNFISSSGSVTVINYSSGSDFVTSYGSDSARKSYGSYGSGSTTLNRQETLKTP